MKILIKIAILVIAFAFSAIPISAGGTYSTYVYQYTSNETPEEYIENNRKHRTPPAPVECVISEDDGVRILSPSVSIADIISFEIWDTGGEACIATFTDQMSFIEYLFSMTGNIQLRLITTDSQLIGDISL